MSWFGTLRFAGRIAGNLFRKPRTEGYPFAPPTTPASYKGRIEIDAEKCVGCSTCAQVCIGLAIRLEEQPEGIRLMLWHSRCCFCGLCAYYCPTQAIRQTNDWQLHHANADKYAQVEDILAKYQTCIDCGARLMVPKVDVVTASAIGAERYNQAHSPRCDACRRTFQARQIVGVKS